MLKPTVRCAWQPILKISSADPLDLLARRLAALSPVETLRAELREAGFVRLSALEVASRGSLTDSGPYRAKSFPVCALCLKKSTNRAWPAWKPTLFKGQCHLPSKYMLLWANKDSGKDLVNTNRRKVRLVTNLELLRDSSEFIFRFVGLLPEHFSISQPKLHWLLQSAFLFACHPRVTQLSVSYNHNPMALQKFDFRVEKSRAVNACTAERI